MENSSLNVKDALIKFLNKHKLEDVIGSIDEIVLEYVVSILGELGQDTGADDVDQFTDMMEAYLPGFAAIPNIEVCEWMFDLATRLSQTPNKENTAPSISLKQPEISDKDGISASPPKQRQIDPKGKTEVKPKYEVGSPEGLCLAGSGEQMDEQLQILLEMFPMSCAMEVSHCLMVSNGNTDQAAQLLIHREQIGDAISGTSLTCKDGTKKRDEIQINDKKIREQMIARYAYIDEQDDKVVHKPIIPKQGPKKMVRYLDGRVVSTKGEKFTEIKKEEDSEMKKTYVNIKPARKYRFH